MRHRSFRRVAETRASRPRRSRRWNPSVVRSRRRPFRGLRRLPRSAAARQRLPSPADTDNESTIVTWQRPLNRSAASRADWWVADTLEESVTQTMPLAPSASSLEKACPKSPGEGDVVWGRTLVARRRFQNSAGLRSTPSVNSSSPKRTFSGTTSIACSSATTRSRSAELSVTTRTVMAFPLRSFPIAARERPTAPGTRLKA